MSELRPTAPAPAYRADGSGSAAHRHYLLTLAALLVGLVLIVTL